MKFNYIIIQPLIIFCTLQLYLINFTLNSYAASKTIWLNFNDRIKKSNKQKKTVLIDYIKDVCYKSKISFDK